MESFRRILPDVTNITIVRIIARKKLIGNSQSRKREGNNTDIFPENKLFGGVILLAWQS